MKRIVHVSTVHHSDDVRIFQKQCLSLKAAGYDVHLVAREAFDNPEGITVHALGGSQGLLARLKAQSGLVQMLHDLNGDLYHFHDPELLAVASRLKKKSSAPLVYDKHESTKGKSGIGKAATLLERKFIPEMHTVVIAESSYAKELPSGHPPVHEVLNYYKISGALPEAKKPPSKGESIQLVYSGFVSRQRGLDAMLELAEGLRDKDLNFRINVAGQCQIAEDRRWMESQLEKRKLTKYFRLIGWDRYLSQKEIEACHNEAHLALSLLNPLPNYVESIPTKFYEYMHFGLPIICSDFPLWQKFMDENPVGICVAPKGQPDEIVALVEHLMNEETYNSFSEIGVLLSTKFRWKKMENNLLKMYTDLLS